MRFVSRVVGWFLFGFALLVTPLPSAEAPAAKPQAEVKKEPEKALIPENAADAVRRIKKILLACKVYAVDHKGEWPEDWQTLVKGNYIKQRGLMNPALPQRTIGYIYLKPPAAEWKLASPGRTVVLYEAYEVWPERGITVGFADRSAYFVAEEAAFKKLLDFGAPEKPEAEEQPVSPGQVRVEGLMGYEWTGFAVKGEWLFIGANLRWCYESGKEIRYIWEGPRVYISVDGAPRCLAGIRLFRSDDLAALPTALAESPGPLTVWVWCAVVDKLSVLLQVEKINSLQVGPTARVFDLSVLAKFSKLNSLSLRGCHSVSDLSPLANLSNLTSLDLSQCRQVSDLSPLAKLSNLTVLDLEGCREVSDLSPLAKLTRLTSLNLRFCHQVSDLSPLANFTNLTSLNISVCDGVSDFSPLANLNKLSLLEVTGCINVNDLSPLRAMVRRGGRVAVDNRLKPQLEKLRTGQPFEVKILKRLEVGDLAPLFEAKTLDGKPLKLKDYRGKFVLLDFWATWCGPCLAQTPYLKATYEAFGEDERFVMIGLSLDKEVDAPRQYVREKGLKWIQGFLGEWSKTSVPDDYGVRGIPSIFLIGPDGEVIAKNLHHETIKLAVAKALGTS